MVSQHTEGNPHQPLFPIPLPLEQLVFLSPHSVANRRAREVVQWVKLLLSNWEIWSEGPQNSHNAGYNSEVLGSQRLYGETESRESRIHGRLLAS